MRAVIGARGTIPAALAASTVSIVTRASACNCVTARYSASSVVAQSCSRAIRHAVPTRHPVAEEADLQRRATLVVLQCDGLVEVTVAHARQEERERLRADDVRRDELMITMDVDTLGDEMEQRRRIDHIAGHVRGLISGA